jgi:glycosyltransferase involved in cell wall biosynthesis
MQYATALAQRGDVVDVIALSRSDALPKQEVLNGVNVFRIQSRQVNEKGLLAYGSRILRFLLRSAWFLRGRHKQQPYDVVHVHNVPDLLVFAALMPKLGGARVVLDIHDLLPEFYASKFKADHDSMIFKIMTVVERLSARFADHVIIANHLWRDRFIARSCPAEKCSVVRNRPDLDIFVNPSGPHRKNEKFQLIYPGSLNWHQGLDIGIRAFASLEARMPDAEFHIYGEGPAKPSLIALAEDLGQTGRVIFHNFLPSAEIAKAMAKADLGVEPKRTGSGFSNEALSTKIMEFMALSVPVVACRTRIHAYYYDDSIIEYYENDDPAQLAEKILMLYENPGRRQELVENAREYVKENTWNARKGEYLDLVDSLVHAGTTTSALA